MSSKMRVLILNLSSISKVKKEKNNILYAHHIHFTKCKMCLEKKSLPKSMTILSNSPNQSPANIILKSVPTNTQITTIPKYMLPRETKAKK